MTVKETNIQNIERERQSESDQDMNRKIPEMDKEPYITFNSNLFLYKSNQNKMLLTSKRKAFPKTK